MPLERAYIANSRSKYKRAAQSEQPSFRTKDRLALATSRYRSRGVGLRLELLPVVLNEVQLLSMTIAGVEVILHHLSVCLVIVPMIVIETVYRTHDSGAMPSAGAVHVKLAGGRDR